MYMELALLLMNYSRNTTSILVCSSHVGPSSSGQEPNWTMCIFYSKPDNPIYAMWYSLPWKWRRAIIECTLTEKQRQQQEITNNVHGSGNMDTVRKESGSKSNSFVDVARATSDPSNSNESSSTLLKVVVIVFILIGVLLLWLGK